MSQERQGLINIGIYLEFIDFYEYDNHLYLCKSIVKTFKLKIGVEKMDEEMIH